MAKRSVHPADKAVIGGSTLTPPCRTPSAAVLALVWAAVTIYLVLFYWTPLPDASPSSEVVLRRGHLLLSIFEADRIAAEWFTGASWSALPQRAMVLAVSAAILLVACAAGWVCLRLTRVDCRLSRLEAWVFSAGVGLNLISLFALALGLAGVMLWWVFVALAVAILACAGVLAWQRSDPPAEPGAEGNSTAPLSLAPLASTAYGLQPTAFLWLCVPFVAAILLHAMLPPVDFDVREYHLQAPKEFYQQGRIQFLPHNVYANMPLGAEMLSLVGMIAARDWWTGGLVGKTLIALFAPLTALVLLAAGRRFATPTAGVVAALVYLSIPWIALVSMHGLIDGALAFYLVAALYGVMLWSKSGQRGQRSSALVALAGFTAGSAVSTKYPALLFCVLPLAAWVACASVTLRRGASPPRPTLWAALRPPATFVLFVALGCGLWLAKNVAFTGNPVYPLLYDVFGGRTRTAELNERWTRAHDPPNYRAGDLAAAAARVTLTSYWLSPLVVPLAALGILAVRRRLTWWLAAYVGYVFVTWWFFTHRIDRFWIPILPVAALLAGIGATWTDARWWRVGLVGMLILGLASNFLTITSRAFGDNRYLADYGILRIDPLGVDPWHLVLNEHAGEVTRVLLVGDAQPFDLVVPANYNTVFDDNQFEQLARGRTPEQVRQALAEREISHVYVDWSDVARYRSPGNYGMTDFVEPSVFARLVRGGVLARLPPIAGNPNELYRVLPSSPKRAAAGERR